MDNTPFSFAFVTDPQIGMNSPQGLNGPGSDRGRLEFAIDFINTNGIDFTIFGGDHINSTDSDEELDIFLECVARLEVPHYGVTGNHDLSDPREDESIYTQRNAPDGFSFIHKNVFFYGLNASRLRGNWGEDLQREGWDELKGAFGSLGEDCTARFVVMHWPLFASHPCEEETYWNMQNRGELVDFFRENNVTCVLSGHWHQDIDAVWNGVRFSTSIGLSKPIQYPEETSFKVITVFEGGWSIRRVSVENV